MTAPTISTAADYLPGSQLAAGAYPGTRRPLFRIAGGKPNPAGNAAAPIDGILPHLSAQHSFRSSKHQPTHNIRGGCSERNETIPVRAGNSADLRAGRLHPLSPDRPVLRLFSLVDLLGRHPSVRSPAAITSGASQPQRDSSGDRSVGKVVQKTGSFIQKSGRFLKQYGGRVEYRH